MISTMDIIDKGTIDFVQLCPIWKLRAYYLLQKLSFRLLTNLKIKIHKTIILSVVLYGCEALTPVLREECKLRVLENRVLGE